MTRTESRLELIQRAEDSDASMGELVSRLAHEGKELAVVELERLRVEMREQARRAAKTAAAGYLAVDLVALVTLALSVGVFLVLADAWDSYAAAAFATSGFLAIAAVAVGLVARSMMRRMTEVVKRDVRTDLAKTGGPSVAHRQRSPQVVGRSPQTRSGRAPRRGKADGGRYRGSSAREADMQVSEAVEQARETSRARAASCTASIRSCTAIATRSWEARSGSASCWASAAHGAGETRRPTSRMRSAWSWSGSVRRCFARSWAPRPLSRCATGWTTCPRRLTDEPNESHEPLLLPPGRPHAE